MYGDIPGLFFFKRWEDTGGGGPEKVGLAMCRVAGWGSTGKLAWAEAAPQCYHTFCFVRRH